MVFKRGDIVKNFEPNELVEIDSVDSLGTKFLFSAIGCITKRQFKRPLSEYELNSLIIVRGKEFTYDGDSKLFLFGAEAERISIAYQYDPMFAVNSSIVDELPHQVEAVYKYLLPLPRIRFLLADDTGAGKTIMTGLLLKELFFRGTIEKVLIITPGGLTKQWLEDELHEKFGLQFRLIDRSVFKSNPNEFSISDRCITSIDFLRQPDVSNAIENIQWDMVIVDEAHKLSAFEYGIKTNKSERYKAVEKLSNKTDHLLFLTATPHRGRKDTFRRLMMLLDEDLFTKDEHIKKAIIQNTESFEMENKIENSKNKFFLRRLKEDMVNWDNEPLYKEREVKTPGFELTEEELKLYSEVTNYVQKLRKEAKEKRNRNVELMLMVMQRRLASSIYAITQTLSNRAKRLNEVLLQILEAKKRNLKFNSEKTDEDLPISEDEYDELNDDEGDKIFNKHISRYVLSLDPEDVKNELSEVNKLVKLAESLKDHEEQKFVELKKLLDESDIIRNEDGKLVIFTEHRDTLNNLKERLENKGIIVSIIHGQMNVDERKKAQRDFRLKSKILIATDAAGEGINLQFCNYMINWDIPWNPNRLEQRMGRIHRYGQKKNVQVFNIVAQNTREGAVLKKLLDKLDTMRESLGTDRVYDVIDELLEGISLSELIQENSIGNIFEKRIEEKLEDVNMIKAKELINIQKKQSLLSKLDMDFSSKMRNLSDERKLQPLYIEKFFLNSFEFLNGIISKDKQYPVFYIKKIPIELLEISRDLKINVHDKYENPFVFDKSLVSVASPQNIPFGTKLLGPGHPLFECLIKLVKRKSSESFAKGVNLTDPNINKELKLWIVKSTVKDNRKDEKTRIANQKLNLILSDYLGLRSTSPAYLINCVPNTENKSPLNESNKSNDEISIWAYENITEKQIKKVRDERQIECDIRKQYIEGAFTDLISDRTSEISELDQLILYGEDQSKERDELEKRIFILKERKMERLNELSEMLKLNAELPEVISSAIVYPLNEKLEIAISKEDTKDLMFEDPEVERIAMEVTMNYERTFEGIVKDVSKDNLGYDIRSERKSEVIRYIEVKGRATTGAIILTENEVNRLKQLEDKAWLYIITYCNSENPKINIIRNPIEVLERKEIIKQVQYLVKENSWKKNLN